MPKNDKDAKAAAVPPRTREALMFEERLAKVTKRMTDEGRPMKVVSRHRTREQQAALYAQGRTAPGYIVTDASGEPGRESHHQTGTAADSFFPNRKLYDRYGAIAKEEGLTWGGDWRKDPKDPKSRLGPDPAHIQLGQYPPGRKPLPAQPWETVPGRADHYSDAKVTNPPRSSGTLGALMGYFGKK